MDKKQAQKEQLIKLIKAGGTDKELAILDEINALSNKVDTSIQEVKSSLAETLQSVDEKVTKLADPLRGVDMLKIKGQKGEPGKDGLDGKDGLNGKDGKDGIGLKGENGKDGANGINGSNGKDGVNGLDGTNGTNGKDGSPDTAIQVRDKIESLQGDERLDVKSIKGFEQGITQPVLDRAIGILDSRTSFLINKVNTVQTQVNNLPNPNATNNITAVSNAATIPITSKINTVTNSSAATLTITLATTGAFDGQLCQVRVLDFSAAAQTITWVNTENGEGTAPTTSNGSTTLPRASLFQYNSLTSKWRCIAA